MKNITLEQLLEAGCHFGHQVTRQNPKAREFIFEARDNIHIIDLEKTKEGLEDAGKFIKNLAKNGGSILVLGTKRQSAEVLENEIDKMENDIVDGIYWVTKRWIGGTFTNLSEVSKNFKKLKDLEAKLKDEDSRARFTKREIGEWEKERVKLQSYYGGVAKMKKLPEAIFILDIHMEELAIREAMAVNVKIVGITDTNSDPTVVDYPIPANDDAVGSVKLIIEYILDAWREGKKSLILGEEKKADSEKKKELKKEEKSDSKKDVVSGGDKKVKKEKGESDKREVKKEASKKK